MHEQCFMGLVMAKYYDIKGAFVRSITVDSKRGKVVTTVRFVYELAKVNHFWSLQEANDWITKHQSFFRDYTDCHSEEKRYFLVNMGYVR